MKRRTWALVTGAIRNDVYLRIVIIKLCDLRANGIIEQIVLSTWKGEIDKFPDLRAGLNSLNIILVEEPYIDEVSETVFNYIAFARQRASISHGVQVIPNGVFVLRLRTDNNIGISSRGFMNFLSSDVDISINRYGMYPAVFDSKLVVYLRSFRELMFPEDRYFYASKETMNKVTTFVSNHSMWKKGLCTDGQIMCGYIYQTYQFFREIWRIIPGAFYGYLHDYCKKNGNENLVLPRLIHRIYATVCVSLYTQYYMLNDDVYTDEPICLIDLFSDKIRTNNQIERIVMGKLTDTELSRTFKDELRKLALDLPEAHSYTYEEYEELCNFVEEKLQRKIIQPYPYKDMKSSISGVDKEKAGNILLKPYEEKDYAAKIVSAIDDEFDFVSRNLYLKAKDVASKNSKLNIDLWKMAIFESDLDAIYEYGRELYHNRNLFDNYTFLQAIRFLGFNAFKASQNPKLIVSLYDYLNHYNYFFNIFNLDKEIKERLVMATNSMIQKVYHKGQKRGRVISAEEWLTFIVDSLYRQLGQGGTATCITIIQALLMIKPINSPFSNELIERLKKNGKEELVKEIMDIYHNTQYNPGNWMVSVELTQLLQKKERISLLKYASKLKGELEAREMLKCFWNMLWGLQGEERVEVIDAIEMISTLFLEPPFIVKANRFLNTNKVDINKSDMIDIDNFIVMLEILYRKKSLQKNVNAVMVMCFGDREREVILQSFLRLESDKRLDFFSMKSGNEMWLHYMPYMEHGKSKAFQIPVGGDGRTWPLADRENKGAFAAYMKLMGNDVFISIEMSARDMSKARLIAQKVGYEENNSHGSIVRLLTKKVPIKGEDGLAGAVNETLDEFCKVGDKVVAALDSIEL